MVSFSCEACGDVLTKKKLDPHRNRCHGATFTCIDCMVHFPGLQYRSHTSCMTEDQKYQGALYKDKSKKQKGNNYDANSINNNNHIDHNINNNNNNNNNNSNFNQYQTTDNDATMAHHAYVEDCGEDREYEWDDFEGHSDDNGSPSEPPPEAPTPPPAAHEDHVDVFEFLVAASAGQTPNASKLNLADADAAQSTSLVRYEPQKSEELPDPAAFMDENGQLVQFAPEPQPPAEFVTPAPKHSRRKSREGSEKKDKKRKRLHVEVPDQEMTDAPPMLHTGLTGGLNRMMRPIFPPSPDYSGGDAPEVSPASPLKKTKHSKSKHSKHSKNGQVTNSIFGMMAASKAKKVKSKSSSKSSSKSKSKTSSSSSKKHSSKEKKSPQMIEFRPQSKDGKEPNGENQVILFKPRADVFLGFVDKGPESEKGCSMNKILKRFHRERQASGSELGKGVEEKELWRSLRLRQNDRGEVVLFSVE